MSDYIPNPQILSLISRGVAPDPHGNVLFSFTGGKDSRGVVRCDHGWDAVARMSDKVWGCAGYVKHERGDLQRDGIACGFFLRALDVDTTPFRLNARAYNEFDWGVEAPDENSLAVRRLYRQGKSPVDNSADILQGIYTAACARQSLLSTIPPVSGKAQTTPNRASRRAKSSSPYSPGHRPHRGSDTGTNRPETSLDSVPTPMRPVRLSFVAPQGYSSTSGNPARTVAGPSRLNLDSDASSIGHTHQSSTSYGSDDADRPGARGEGNYEQD